MTPSKERGFVVGVPRFVGTDKIEFAIRPIDDRTNERGRVPAGIARRFGRERIGFVRIIVDRRLRERQRRKRLY